MTGGESEEEEKNQEERAKIKGRAKEARSN